ncbi:MAG: hypothetical protein ONB48_11690 [candidate division KSB1 bacterium]|nr:hypothetical protein [candidate division KSB1 bacterium]MDZ7275382.1 hypothetical protein [candidate division KSB1 bacterium]MDZ7286305.1 hypothetical protein [candidate division KSB1 bacterium]MDZ7296532.1 hypothetical protein [candidate division KSB1 bacterium]MDZ7309149.1 hypothetical protein [candidate division KSB1 bacterium]
MPVWLALGLALSACSNDTPSESRKFSLHLTAVHLEPLAAGEGHYELWLSFPQDATRLQKPVHGDEAYVSFGKFNLTDSGQLVDLHGRAMVFAPPPGTEVDINLAVDALLTIEQENDTDKRPGARLLGGEFTGSDRRATATLRADSKDAVGFDFTRSSGSYILQTPSTLDTLDFNRGLWWMLPNGGSGLGNWPALSDTSGWQYEGWLVDHTGAQPHFYSTGTFSRASGADADGPGATAGSSNGPAFPGQDFVQAAAGIPLLPPLDNGNFAVQVTLEPVPDNSRQPFYLVILRDDRIEPNSAGPRTAAAMQNVVAGSFPGAVVVIDR